MNYWQERARFIPANDPLGWINFHRQIACLAVLKEHKAPDFPELAARADQTVRLLAELPELTPTTKELLLRQEAEASSEIEDETNEEQIRSCLESIRELTAGPVTTARLLRSHKTLMDGRLTAQPGEYRTVRVRVGTYVAPEYVQVPWLMRNRLFRYLKQSPDPAPVKAAWAHLVFETIHPFADGNGRTGRGLITAILGQPLPVSRGILAERQKYYRLLSRGKWEDFACWLLTRINQACEEIKEEAA